MLPSNLVRLLDHHDSAVRHISASVCVCPTFDPSRYYHDAAASPFIHVLARLRHCVELVSDHHFSEVQSATKVDLFMLTTSVSSPMSPGSNSQPIPLRFGPHDAFLTDSSQFGFEPLLLNGFDQLYCYLPSMRGEDWDARHLNQFFHCEAEIKGALSDVMRLVETYIGTLAEALLHCPTMCSLLSLEPANTAAAISDIATDQRFERVTFDEACDILGNDSGSVLFHPTGRDLTAAGEIELLRRVGGRRPIWVTHYDRDRVPFYQKPDPLNHGTVLNADLLFPPLLEGAFGGEVAGAGQRQDTKQELIESLARQAVDPTPYEWYIDMRTDRRYTMTSGFGLGIERLLTWLLCRADIKDVALYPRLKGVLAYP